MLKMIDLPYPFNALEPYYSTKTLELHYQILYKGYVENTNKAFHPKENNWVGYLVELGETIYYIAGDTDITPVGTEKDVREFEENLINDIQCKILIK